MRRLALLLSLPALLVAAPATREMSLTTPDGFTLKGTLTIPEGKGKHPVVILAHQFRSDRTGWAELPQKLQARGIATLALDLRGHGASTQKKDATVTVSEDFDASAKAVGFDQIPSDLALAAAWVRKQPGIRANRLALAGSSVGATSVILAGPKVHPVAILALSPGGVPQDLAKAAERTHSATMVMGSEGEKYVMDAMAALKPVLGVHNRVFEGSEHGFAYLKDHTDVMAVFLAEYLLDYHSGAVAKTEKADDTKKEESVVTIIK